MTGTTTSPHTDGADETGGVRGGAGWAVDVRHLTVASPAGHLLTDVNLRLPEGRCLGVVGETGSGKSLVCRSALGLLPAGLRITDGQVHVAGHDMTTASRKQWQTVRGTTVAMVPQASMSSLDPLRTVGFQLRETIKRVDPDADRRERAVELLDQMQIRAPREVIGLYPHELSGGMRQRVMMALALSGRPRILVADEPTTALDTSVQKHILDILCDLKQAGMSILVVSHDLGVIRYLADDVAVMYAGTTVEAGTRDALFEKPLHPYTRALKRVRLTPEQRKQHLPGLPGTPPSLPVADPGCRFAARCALKTDECLTLRPTLVPRLDRGQTHLVACVHADGPTA
jgi:oligopeptide/dipeptide ABC transporter ATP-binding protein